MCTIARSGSTWLCDLVSSTGLLGSPMEYLLNLNKWYYHFGLPEDTRLEDYLAFLLEYTSTPNGVFGVKGSREQLEPFFNCFGNVPCVWLRRRNKLEQAISWYRAAETGLWHIRRDSPRPTAPFNRARINQFLEIIEEREAEWTSWFSHKGVLPLEIFYEQACQNPLAAVRAIAEYVGIQSAKIQCVNTRHQIMRDETTSRWLRRLSDISDSA